MTIDQMRVYVGSQYDSPGWKRKVQKMPDGQVIALYYKFKTTPKRDPLPF